jgi:hypothetical protein
VSSDPINCEIDPRQPNEPNTTTNTQGPSSVVVTMNADNCQCSTAAFDIAQFPSGFPIITISACTPNVGGDPRKLRLTFNRPISFNRYTCVQYAPNDNPMGQQICIANLPGDVDNDRITRPIDMTRLVNCLSGGASCPTRVCDIDRSLVCAGKDILRLADLENGAEQYPVFNQQAITVECPSMGGP